MDDLSLAPDVVDAQVAEVRHQHADPWLARRARRMGASDVPALLIAYDPRPDEVATARRYHLDAARIVRTVRGPMPLVIARKAGLRRPQASSLTMQRGQRREVELLRRWAAGPCEILDDSLVLAHEMPPWARHVIDHDCDALAATLDAHAIDVTGQWVPVEAKCPRGSVEAPPWYWRAQVQAQMAVVGCPAGVLVVGQGWGACDEGGGKIVSWVLERSDDEIARIREACRRGAADLARAKEGA